jgi:hypothetical protein
MSSESFRGHHGLDPSEFSQDGSFRHGSSRMLENYLTDLEYLLRERMWPEALPLALALPHICVALADENLRSSRERFIAWCEAWLVPSFPVSFSPAPTADELYALTRERGGFKDLDAASGVPIDALKRLRLRRLARPAPPRRRAALQEFSDVTEDPSHSVCLYIMHAVHRWYDDWASLDATVQTNLARLAVLR